MKAQHDNNAKYIYKKKKRGIGNKQSPKGTYCLVFAKGEIK